MHVLLNHISTPFFVREDFRRVFPGEIGDIGFPPRVLEAYAVAVESTVDVEAIHAEPA
jgi:hypothetical protein